MQENKFRGLTINDEWVYGNLTVLKAKYQNVQPGTYISNAAGMPFAYEVQPHTVGQYVGRKDINENEIFEGDNVKINPSDYRQYTIQYHGRTTEFLARHEDGGWSKIGILTKITGNIHQNKIS